MKRIAYVVILAGLASAGCISWPFFRDDKKPPQVEMVERAPAAVTADTVTDQNAGERAKALREELEHDVEKRPKFVEKKP